MARERHRKAEELLGHIKSSNDLRKAWEADPLALLREHGLGEHEALSEEASVKGAGRHGMAREEALRLHRDSLAAVTVYLRRLLSE